MLPVPAPATPSYQANQYYQQPAAYSGIDIEYARAVAATTPQPFPIVDSDKKRSHVRLDQELADRINARCDASAVAHVEEVRRILAAAFGMDRPALLRFVQRHGQQDALPIAEAS